MHAWLRALFCGVSMLVMPVTESGQRTEPDLAEDWFAWQPGCEIQPHPDSDKRCGKPAADCMLCEAWHWRGCNCAVRFRVWVCGEHRESLIAGRTCCTVCRALIVVVALL